jgi:hypothetical protein
VEPIVAVWVRAPVASFDTEPAQGPGQLEGPPDHPAGVESPGGLQEESQPPLPQNIRVAGPAVMGPSLAYPLGSERGRPDGRDHTQLHAVHVQSTFSSHSVHFQSTWGSTYVDPRTWFPMPGDIGESMAFNAGWWKPCRTM